MALDRPRSPAASVSGRWPALALAIAVHVAFIAVLVFSLRWQNRKPEPVTAELYAPPAKTATAEPVEAKPTPAPEPPPAPPPPAPPEPEPAPPPKAAPPPKPVPQPEPKVERPPDTRSADIARKAKEDEERRQRDQQALREKAEREKAEREKREAEQREAEKKKQAEQRRIAESRERQQRETEALRAQAEREQTRVAQQAEAAASARAEADYIRRIQAKIKGNVVLPPDLPGNPEAIFEVVQLPTGEIIDAVLRKSSGSRPYDDAVQRAIIKSSPLPRPDRPELFQRALTLKFRPLD
jgi:colicin import membrane protein